MRARGAQRLLTALALAVLAACGNTNEARDSVAPARMVVQSLAGLGSAMLHGRGRQSAADREVALRAKAEASGAAAILVSNHKLRYAGLHQPIASNAGVVTWASADGHQVALRDGIVVATRGFGPDLMSSDVPSLAQIARGSGTTARRHFYLDGADRRQELDYECQLAVAGSEEITILGRVYQTRKVNETCAGPQGTFENAYWFDAGQGRLRQSSQLLIPGLDNLVLSRVTGED